jgi:Pro-kumamolisin, activation domain
MPVGEDEMSEHVAASDGARAREGGELQIADFVLYAEQRLTLGAENRVQGGDIGVRSAARDPAGGQLSAGSDSVIEPDRAIISPSVTLGHSVVRGEILSDALVDHGVPLRPERPFPISQMPALPLAPAPPAGTEGVTVPAGQATSLTPGSYGALQVDGSLVLNPGEYVFSSITVGRKARMVSVGTVQVLVLGYLVAGWEAEIHPLFEQEADQLAISVAGTDQSAALPTVSFAERSRLCALLSAPHGSVTLADRASVRGAVAGFGIITGEDVEVTFECGFPQDSGDQQGSQQLAGAYGVPPGPDTDPVAGPVPAATGISLSIGLPVRDGAGLQALIDSVSDPKSPQFRQYISPGQFNTSYGATAGDYAALQSWADGAGFNTIATFPNNLLLRVTGTAAQVQEALFVNLFYRVRPDGSQYVATDRQLSLNLSVPVLEINGLGDSVLPVSLALNGTGGGGSYRAADLRNAYLGVDSPFQALDGSGQNVGIVGFVTFTGSDVTGYFDNQVPAQGEISPLPAPNATVVEVEAAPIFGAGPPSNSNIEADLDVEMVYAMAPRATISFFQGTTGITDRLDSILHGMATFTPALTVASCSLSFGKSDNSQQALDQMAAQGVSFFTASGDSGSTGQVFDSTKMNHQTLVGGTILSTNPLTTSGGTVTYPVPYYAGESTWPGSGGGIISDVAIPAYQTGIMQLNAASNGGSLTNRNYPDVAMLSPNAEIFAGGSLTSGFQGTSFAAPLWAGFTALVNQFSLQNNAGLMGFLNPTLYDIGLTINDSGDNDLYDLCFNDIQDKVSNGGFESVRGYDLVTGLGSPKTGLITQLGTISPTTPATLNLIRFIVGTGGDDLRNDSTATANVFLKNGGQFTVTLKAKNAGDWGNGFTTPPIDFSIPNTVTLPTIAEGLSGVQINLIQGGSFPETDDNWDISTLQVSLFNPGTSQVCQLNLVGTSELQDGSTGLVRLSGSPGSSGVGPSSPIFNTGPGSGC